jgi:hypothetical protein
MFKKLILLAIIVSALSVSCAKDPNDPNKWVKKLDISKTERKAALEKLEFIYEVDTTLYDVCLEFEDKEAWGKRLLAIHARTKAGSPQRAAQEKATRKQFEKYKGFCKKYFIKLAKRIPIFRKIVIPSLLTSLEKVNETKKDWHKDLLIKLLIRFQSEKEPIEPKRVQEYFISVIKEFGEGDYLLGPEKIDSRTVIALRGLKKLNETNPHPETFKVLKEVMKKIYKSPEEVDSISQVRMALVDLILDIGGKGNYKNKKANDKAASEILVSMIRRGKHDTADEKYFCKDKFCKQNFLINKRAAVKLGELGISNKDINYTLVACLYSVELGLGRKRKSFRECKVALAKLYKPEHKGKDIDPVGILALLGEGDPSRYPVSYDGKKDKWYAYKIKGETKEIPTKFVLYGDNLNQSSLRSATVKACMKNYDKYRKSNFFKYSARRKWRELKRFQKKRRPIKFPAFFENFTKKHKVRTDKWGELACGVFVLNKKGGWDKKDSAVVERTAIEALRGMGAVHELQELLLCTYSSFAMKAYWDFTAREEWKASKIRCKKEGMLPMYIRTHCVPKYNNSVGGIKSQWNKLKDYNWLVDSSKEAMYSAGWLTTEVKSELSRRVRKELLKRMRWLRDPRSTVFAAKAVAMLPYEDQIFNQFMDVVISKLDKKSIATKTSKKSKKAKKAKKGLKKVEKEVVKAEAWHIASELLWEQFRQQSIQLIQTGKDAVFCKKLTNDKNRKECVDMYQKRFDKAMTVFGQWSFNRERWTRSRYIWIDSLQDFFGYWPIDAKTNKPTQMTPEQRFSEYKKWNTKCIEKLKVFTEAQEKAKKKSPEDEPWCNGYDISKKWGWNIRASKSAKGMRKAGISPVEAEKRLILSGYERIRLDILESAFNYSDVSKFDALMKIKALDIMKDPGLHPLSEVKRDKLSEAQKIDYELMVQRPWDAAMEANRVKRAIVVINLELKKFKKPIVELRRFLSKYKGRSGETDLNNISTLALIIKTVSIQKPCPLKTKKGKIPSCAVFKDVYNDKTGEWTKKREDSMKTIITPWKARHKALLIINGWKDELGDLERKKIVKEFAMVYGKSEIPVRKAILLVLDRWGQGSDYKAVSQPMFKVIDFETKNHRRGGYLWMNQEAISFLGRLKGRK